MISTGVEVEMSKLTAALADLMNASGCLEGSQGRKFVARQAGLLAETLIRVTPPLDRSKTAASIEASITGKFTLYGTAGRDYGVPEDSKHGTGSVRWYAWGSDYLHGVDKASDMTGASVEDLYRIMFQRTSRGMINAGNRGKQRVRIWQKLLARSATVKKLAVRIVRHIGRQKAGWLPSWDSIRDLGGMAASSRPPGPWITRHRNGARGDFVDNLTAKNAPSVTLINQALGISKATELLRAAIRIRIKAIQRDMILYLKGIKQKHGMI